MHVIDKGMNSTLYISMNLYDTIEVGLVMDKVKVEWGAPLPPVTRRKKRSKYTPIVEEFLTRPETTARVTIDDLKAQAIAAGLKTAINGLGVAEKVHVSNRSVEGVWLVKADAVVENRTAQG